VKLKSKCPLRKMILEMNKQKIKENKK